MVRIFIYDLDGTIIDGNTFSKWVFYSLSKGALFDWKHAFKVLFFTIKRKFLFGSHVDFKMNLDSLSPSMYLIDKYADYLDGFFRPFFFNDPSSGHSSPSGSIRILSTAAPSCYIPSVLKACRKRGLFFDHVVSSGFDGQIYFNNFEANKVASLYRLLDVSSVGDATLTFYTDSLDDLPLCRVSEKVYFFGSLEDFHILHQELPKIEVIYYENI